MTAQPIPDDPSEEDTPETQEGTSERLEDERRGSVPPQPVERAVNAPPETR